MNCMIGGRLAWELND